MYLKNKIKIRYDDNMNIKLNISLSKDEGEKLKKIDGFSKDLKRPYRMDTRIKILAYGISILTIISMIIK